MNHTMKMPADMKANWLVALRSGEFKQGAGLLCSVDGSYCCLGVLQKIVDGDVERWDGTGNVSKAMLSLSWQNEHGIEVDQVNIGDVNMLGHLANMNDGGSDFDGETIEQHSFLEIADFIEANVEGVDSGS